MGSLVKLSEATGVAEERIHEMIRLIMLKWEDVECSVKMIQELCGGSFAELESKEKHLTRVQESLIRRCKEFDLKRRSAEEGLKKLDEKEKFLKGMLQEIEGEKLQNGKMRDSVDEQLKEVALKEQEFEGLFQGLKLVHSQVERRKNEFDLTEESFRRREAEIDAREEMLGVREKEADSNARILAESFRRREAEIDAREKMLGVREKEADSNARILADKEKLMNSEAQRINTREKELKSLEKELEVHQEILDLKLKLFSLKSSPEISIQEPHSASPPNPKIWGKRRKRSMIPPLVSPVISDANVGINVGKTSLVGDKFSGRLEKTGWNDKSKAQSCKQQPVVIDVSGSDSDAIGGNLASNPPVGCPSSSSQASNPPVGCPCPSSSSHGKLARQQVNAGETWACFDRKHKMGRSYALVMNVIDKDAKVEVTWLKPCPVYKGEEEWIKAGFPVACGKFERGITSVESPAIFSHPVLCSGGDPCIIVPCAGETWAIYKDWDITQPEIHTRTCEYEIVEILSYFGGDGGAPSSLAVRVAYLDKINATVNSFQRRNKNDKDLFMIESNCLYRFSHKVLSLWKSICDTNGILACIFELDLKSIPLGL